jgi:hypothetical protein
VAGGDISADGSEIILRRGSVLNFGSGRTVSQAFGTSSVEVPVIGNPNEPNGEGIGFIRPGWVTND